LHDTGQQGVGLGPGALNFWSEGFAESLFQSPRQRRSNGTVVGICDSVATVATAKVLYNRDYRLSRSFRPFTAAVIIRIS
jgi:hypothetical protein